MARYGLFNPNQPFVALRPMNPIGLLCFEVLETLLNQSLVGRRTTEASGLLYYGVTGALTDGRAYLFFFKLVYILSHVLDEDYRLGVFYD